MGETPGNEGIQAYGGTISVGGSLAVGRNAHAESTHAGGELGAQVAELQAAIERNEARLGDAEVVMADLRRLVSELNEPEPERSRVTALLARLREGAGSVAEIATSLAAVERVIAAVL
jgi:chromosome segregation ATPase